MVMDGKAYETMALIQQKRESDVSYLRGEITDRNGTKLTDTKQKKKYLQSDGTLSDDESDAKYEFELPQRFPETARHIIGYTSSDGQGVYGIEKQFDYVLRNKGKIALSYMADARGMPVDSYRLSESLTGNKSSVSLTIDSKIQTIAEEVMRKYIKKGAAVILDCNSFDVLAMVSCPDYDPEKLEEYKNSENGELLNRALMGYNAGSIFKIVTSSAALEKDIKYTQRQFDCRGRYDLPDGLTFRCHNSLGHGLISFSDAFALSCNCGFYVTGLEVGGDSVVNMARKFGIGHKLLNTDLGESSGNLPCKTEYANGDILNLSIGQGEILITPLQCAVMVATVANGGIRKNVNIVLGYTDKTGLYNDLKNTGSYRVISETTASEISKMMKECVQDGTAAAALDSKADIAGKTGSAESGWVQNGNSLVHGWFCGFFPYENPKYAMAILCEDGKSGAVSCVPPFAEIAEKINEIYPFKQ